jgi:glucokinase
VLVLAGDIGGTKTNLALYRVEGSVRELVRAATFKSAAYSSLDAVIGEFFGSERPVLASAGFGIAGPIVNGEVRTTNLPWHISAAELARLLRVPQVALLNDLESTALAALVLPDSELSVLQPGLPRQGHCGIIAAGTGLGQAYAFWNGQRHIAVGTEGGHADFAPRNELELMLLQFLLNDYSRVSYERLLSGRGLGNIFRFMRDVQQLEVSPEVQARIAAGDDLGAVVGESGVAGSCPASVAAVELFLTLYGAQAGNLALTVMALGGVYVGGGIIVRLLPRLRADNWLLAFRTKGRYSPLMEEIPVRVILNPEASLIGAAQAAAQLLTE